MKITVNGHEYVIKFFYDTVEKFQRPSGDILKGQRRHTLCTFEGDGFTLRGEAICNPKDQYTRVGARRESLKKAIRHFDVGFRKQVWDAYFAKILSDRKKGIARQWGVDEKDLGDNGIYDAATGGIRAEGKGA